MSQSVSDIVAQLMPLIDPKGYTAEQFCEAIKDQPVPSGQYHGCETSEDIANHWLKLAKAGQLAVFRAGSVVNDGKFKAFDIPWMYDARSDTVASYSVEILQDIFENKLMTPRHWGVTAERMMQNGAFPEMNLPQALFAMASAAGKGRLSVEFTDVLKGNPYDSVVKVSFTPEE
ncbi:hypothetical protein RYA05_00900 [Pseudomonas syringae pv. actinidiae]|nr:hypothetical protein [Pseudomonas syringae pv. actinidiae]